MAEGVAFAATLAIGRRVDAQAGRPGRSQSTADLEARHPAVIEGHVPADLISRLLRERPKILGLAVPGMPAGSPGMEAPGPAAPPYRTFMFDKGCTVRVFATRSGG